MIDASKDGSGAAPQAAAVGPVMPSQRPGIASDKPRADPIGALVAAPVAILLAGEVVKARLRRHARLRSREALAPLRTAMWAAYPPGPSAAA